MNLVGPPLLLGVVGVRVPQGRWGWGCPRGGGGWGCLSGGRGEGAPGEVGWGCPKGEPGVYRTSSRSNLSMNWLPMKQHRKGKTKLIGGHFLSNLTLCTDCLLLFSLCNQVLLPLYCNLIGQWSAICVMFLDVCMKSHIVNHMQSDSPEAYWMHPWTVMERLPGGHYIMEQIGMEWNEMEWNGTEWFHHIIPHYGTTETC